MAETVADSGGAMEPAQSEASFVGRGFFWPMQVDHTGSIRLTDGAADIDAAMQVVLTTAPGERVMRAQFGCRIWDLLFEPVTANVLGLMAQAVRDALAQWEPRVEVEQVNAVPDPRDSALVMITVEYRVKATNDRRNLVYPVLRDPPRGGLMALPAPNLDDRTFQDIVDEAKRLIPRYTPEWTNHNLSDPGVALIELFAWMSEMVLYRVNQVPDRLFVHFLNLVGIEPFPPSVARADITFWLSAAQENDRHGPGRHAGDDRARDGRRPGHRVHHRRPARHPAAGADRRDDHRRQVRAAHRRHRRPALRGLVGGRASARSTRPAPWCRATR